VGYRFTATVWKVSGESAWHFLTLPFDVSDEIDELGARHRRGFGSMRVIATIGATTWSTSVFPDNKAKSYVLPVKKSVRVAEGIDTGDEVTIELQLVLDGTSVPSG
jgi:hypothetical protein